MNTHLHGPGRSAASDGRTLKRGPYPKSTGVGFWAAAQVRVRQWNRALRHLEETQLAVMRQVAEANADCEYGRKYGLGSIVSYADWQRNVPAADYDAYFPYIERMMKGEADVLVPGKIKYFGNSSGSSNHGRQKFLPLTVRQLKITSKAAADAAYRLVSATGDLAFTSGYQIGIYPPPVMRRQDAVIVSNNPALMSVNLPYVARPLHLPRGAVKVERNLDRKLERIAQEYFDYDVVGVAGTTCWFSLLFDKVLAEAKKRGLPGESVSEVWPNLRAAFGGGVAAGPYLPVIKQRVAHPDFKLVDTYNATEGGLFACSDHSGAPGMLMIPDRGVFFEFVALGDADSENPARVPLWEVETDTNYVLHVSTVSGLSCYRLGDIVRFVSLDPLRIEFAGRLAGCLSTTQELTTHVEVQDAVQAALGEYPLTTREYTCAADVGIGDTGKAQYNLFVEFEGNPHVDESGFAAAFDRALCRLNRVYREHRENEAAILPPKVTVMPEGTVEKFMRAAGIKSAQAKFPRILSDAQKDILRSVLSKA